MHAQPKEQRRTGIVVCAVSNGTAALMFIVAAAMENDDQRGVVLGMSVIVAYTGSLWSILLMARAHEWGLLRHRRIDWNNIEESLAAPEPRGSSAGCVVYLVSSTSIFLALCLTLNFAREGVDLGVAAMVCGVILVLLRVVALYDFEHDSPP